MIENYILQLDLVLADEGRLALELALNKEIQHTPEARPEFLNMRFHEYRIARDKIIARKDLDDQKKRSRMRETAEFLSAGNSEVQTCLLTPETYNFLGHLRDVRLEFTTSEVGTPRWIKRNLLTNASAGVSHVMIYRYYDGYV